MGQPVISAVLTIDDKKFNLGISNAVDNTKKLEKYAKGASASVEKLDKKTISAGYGFSSLAKKITGVVAGYVSLKTAANLVGSSLNGASNFEGYRNTLNVVMKDTEKAAKTMKWAVNFANKTPFETDSVVEATVRLQAYGLEAKKVLPSIGDMAGVMNKDIIQAVEAVADAQTGELERLKEFGITKQMIIDKAAKTMRGKQIVNNKGQITDQEAFNKALFALMNNRFKGGMEIQANSFKGLMSTVKGVFNTSLAKMIGITDEGEIKIGGAFDVIKGKVQLTVDKLNEWSNNGTMDRIADDVAENAGEMIDKGYNAITSAIKFCNENSMSLKNTITLLGTAYTIHKGVLIATSVAQGIQTTASVASKIASMGETTAIYALIAAGNIQKVTLGAVAAAQWVWNAAMTANPIGATVLAIASLTAALTLLVTNWDKVTGAINKTWEALKKWKKEKGGGSGPQGLAVDSGKTTKKNALGTSYYTSGTTDENGGEIKVLPNGTKVIPHDVSVKSVGGNTNNFNININGSNLTVDDVINQLVSKLKLAIVNM